MALDEQSRNGGVFLLPYSMVPLSLVCIVLHLRLHVGILYQEHTLFDHSERHLCCHLAFKSVSIVQSGIEKCIVQTF